MGRRRNWILSVKKVLSPDSKEKKAKRPTKTKKKWFGKKKQSTSESPSHESVEVINDPSQLVDEVKLTDVEIEPIKEPNSAAIVDEETNVEVIEEVVQNQSPGISDEEMAATRIQTAFRGYSARRALRTLKGIVRLKLLVQGPTVERQTAHTMKCMQALSRVQSQIQSRRLRMLEQNRALQRQILQNREKELENLKMVEEWDDSLQSKEQMESSLVHKYEATMRRERALAYSYTHQQMWKKSTKSSNLLLYMDPTNPHWGWSWLERWTADRPLETQREVEKDPSNDQENAGGEIIKSFTRHQLNSESPPLSTQDKKLPSRHKLPTTPPSRTKASSRKNATSKDDELKSSEGNRRHSFTGSSVRDDESLVGSISVRSYMSSTQSAKAKSKSPGSSGKENGKTPEKSTAGAVKKRLSLPPSPVQAKPRRHSGPPKVDTNSLVTE